MAAVSNGSAAKIRNPPQGRDRSLNTPFEVLPHVRKPERRVQYVHADFMPCRLLPDGLGNNELLSKYYQNIDLASNPSLTGNECEVGLSTQPN